MSENGLIWAVERSRMRTAANNILLHLHPTRVPKTAVKFAYTWGLGGISTLLAMMLAITGILLMFRYEPNVERAYDSILALETGGAFGSLIRAVHHWSANLLVVTAFLHLVRVFMTGGFKKGRSSSWLIGLLLLLLVLASNFTGYLLPWDQLAYWAITVSTSLLDYIPMIGSRLSYFLLGQPEVGQSALRNFYALHVALLPALFIASISYHFWKIRKTGGISHREPREGEVVERVTTIPNLVNREFAAAAVVLTAVFIFSMFFPAPLGAMADPTQSPNPAKAAWYFVGLQELLLHMHSLAAMGLVAFGLLGLIILPYWDRDEKSIGIYFRSQRGKQAVLIGLLLSIILVPALVIVDEFWINLSLWLPEWPALLTTGILPLLLSLGGLAMIYGGLRTAKANHGEALVGLYAFMFTSLIILTVIGFYFRGANMALTWPF